MFDWLSNLGDFITSKDNFPSILQGGASLVNNLLNLSAAGDKEDESRQALADKQAFEASEAEKNRQNQLEQIRLSAALRGGGGGGDQLAAQVARERIRAEMAQAVMQSIMQGAQNTGDAYDSFIRGVNGALIPIRR